MTFHLSISMMIKIELVTSRIQVSIVPIFNFDALRAFLIAEAYGSVSVSHLIFNAEKYVESGNPHRA